jgi:hypothetical protein
MKLCKNQLQSTLRLFLLVAGLSQLIVGCHTVVTRSTKAAGVNLLQYHTFHFAEAKQPSDLRFFTPTNEALVKAAIRTELEKRGLRMAESADVEVCVYLKTNSRTFDDRNPSFEMGSLGLDLTSYYGLLYESDWGTHDVIAYQVGTLVVHAVDVKENRKVWEGVATGVLYRKSSEKQIETRVHESVSGMFKDFPGLIRSSHPKLFTTISRDPSSNY